MIKVRGSIEFPRDLLPDLQSLLLKHQWANPIARGGRSLEGYAVYEEVGEDRVLIPRYSPIVGRLAEFKSSVVKEEPLDIDGSFYEWNPNRPLRSGQVDGAGRAEVALRKKRGIILVGDTGSGKTVLGLWLMAALQGRHTVILVNQIDIAQQWAERIREFVPNIVPKFIMPVSEARAIDRHVEKAVGPPVGKVNTTSVTIGTFQSLYQSKKYTVGDPLRCELLLVDEVHVASAPTFMQAMFRISYSHSAGLTATDDRKDGLDWIFRQCLGKERIEFKGEVLDPIIYKLDAPTCGFKDRNWRTAWCDRYHKMTYHAACEDCGWFEDFPVECGGNLETTQTGTVKWGRTNRAALLSAWSNHPEYITWCLEVIRLAIEKKRSIFVFGDGRRMLTTLYVESAKRWGDNAVGLFLGKSADPQAEGRAYDFQRKTALSKMVTFATYGVARQALDVKKKDCAFFATPISDARQAVGRVRRIADGKRQPVIYVSVPKIGIFIYAWKQLEEQFEENKWKIVR